LRSRAYKGKAEKCFLKYNRKGVQAESILSPLKLKQLFVPFVILLCGWLISFFQFLRERMNDYFGREQEQAEMAAHPMNSTTSQQQPVFGASVKKDLDNNRTIVDISTYIEHATGNRQQTTIANKSKSKTRIMVDQADIDPTIKDITASHQASIAKQGQVDSKMIIDQAGVKVVRKPTEAENMNENKIEHVQDSVDIENK
jgi:hypothetical protein